MIRVKAKQNRELYFFKKSEAKNASYQPWSFTFDINTTYQKAECWNKVGNTPKVKNKTVNNFLCNQPIVSFVSSSGMHSHFICGVCS